MDTGPRPIAFREPTPLLALPALGTEGGLEGVERRLEASQLGFQEAVMKQIQKPHLPNDLGSKKSTN